MDLPFLIGDMASKRGLNTMRITKVQGHADDIMVRVGAVEQGDKDGDDLADEAADWG